MTTTLVDPTPRITRHTTATRSAVVVNPSKFSTDAALERFRAEVDSVFAESDLLAPLWLPTTATTRGIAETRTAIDGGADLVLVAGGDGTVRAVAQELAGTGVALGILPSGTGNLLARNLGLPLGDVRAATRIALEGTTAPIDVGWLELGDRVDGGDETERFAFVVMAGAGIDAQIMANARPSLKARFGPLAYVFTGIGATSVVRKRSVLAVDGAGAPERPSHGFVVGNVGRLSSGLVLMPDASPSDGVLDGVSFLPGSAMEWLRLLWGVMARSGDHRLMPRVRGRSFDFTAEEAQPVEVDGDVVGVSRRVRVSVEPAGLLVRRAAA